MKYYSAPMMALAMLGSMPASAYVFCPGTVSYVDVNISGQVVADWGYGNRALCYIHTDAPSPTIVIPKDVCRAVYSDLVTALASGKQFGTHHSAPTTCAQALATSGPADYWPVDTPFQFSIR